MCLHLTKCCYCIPLGIGVFLIAVNNLFLLIVQIVCAALDIRHETNKDSVNMAIYGFELFAIIMMAVALPFGTIFLIAICTENLCCMVPWKIYSLLHIMVNICIVGFLIFIFSTGETQVYHIIYFVATILYIILTVYGINVVHSYLNQQLDEEDQYIADLERELEERRRQRRQEDNQKYERNEAEGSKE